MELPNTSYLPSRPEDVPAFDAVRDSIQAAMVTINNSQPDSRRKSIAITHLDEALAQAVRGITEANR